MFINRSLRFCSFGGAHQFAHVAAFSINQLLFFKQMTPRLCYISIYIHPPLAIPLLFLLG
jgi:hypothetical protein